MGVGVAPPLDLKSMLTIIMESASWVTKDFVREHVYEFWPLLGPTLEDVRVVPHPKFWPILGRHHFSSS